MIISRKDFEKEVERRVDREVSRIDILQRMYKAESKIHKLYARINKLEKQLEAKGSIKGYYVGKDGEVTVKEDKED